MKRQLSTLALLLFAPLWVLAQDSALRIVEQPRPELPQNHSTLNVQGSTVLRVQFLEFGEIGEITSIKELPSGLTQLAATAARKIKFDPEKKDGKPVTVYRELEYVYSWNGGWRIPSNEDQAKPAGDPAKAEAIIAKAVAGLGGARYLQVRSQIAKGKFSILRESAVVSFQSFQDVIVYPDKERTDFKGNGSRLTQVNVGDTGWIFDGDQELIKIQTASQVADFKRSMRTSLDNLLRGGWRGNAEIAYVGRRPATLGKRNDVLRLTYPDGFSVEFEFATDDATPQKASFRRLSADGQELREEDRYAQFLDVNGLKSPFIVDRFVNGKPSSRINFESIEFDRAIPESIFAKPASIKEAKKEVKL